MTASSRWSSATRRRSTALALLLVALVIGGVAGAPAVSAHPLGNFTVNYSSGLVVEPRGVRVDQVVDRAEISTLQAFPDAKPGVVPAGAAQFERAQCGALAEGALLAVDGQRQPLEVVSTRLQLLPGAAGLATSRLECSLRTSRDVATVGTRLTFRVPPTAGRVGWHEVTARGDGVRLAASDVPASSPSQQLRAYPADLLSSPLDQRTAAVSVVAGSGVVSGERGAATSSSGVLHGLDQLTTRYTTLVTRTTLTPGFALLAVLLSVLLGALHAFAPGHGKTLMAAYLVGREGTWRQAAVIGLSVTVTHTVGVLVLGAVLSAAVLAAPESVYPWLGLVSGLMLAAIGVSLLRAPGRLLSGHDHPADSAHGHGHDHGPDSAHGHDHGHGHGGADVATWVTADDASRQPVLALHATGRADEVAGHGHGHGHGHGAADEVAVAPSSGTVLGTAPPVRRAVAGAGGTLRLALVGLVGGMVPSPSALLVLLGGIALGRAWFGALLVLAYGIGMAGALVGTGLLLVIARDRVERWSARRAVARGRGTSTVLATRLTRLLPRLTALVVVVVGLSLAVNSVRGI